LDLAQNANSDEDDEDEDASPRINMDLYSKAKTFGQSIEERRKVKETLQRLDLLVKSKLKIATSDADGKSNMDTVSVKWLAFFLWAADAMNAVRAAAKAIAVCFGKALIFLLVQQQCKCFRENTKRK
jgi:hypothetical protein